MAIEPKSLGIGSLAGVHVPVSVGIPIHPLNPPPPPRFATFTMDNFGITNTRSRHNDTDFVTLGASIAGKAPVFVTKSMGDVNNGTHSVGLSVEVDIPDDDTIVVFTYAVANSGHGGADAKATKATQAALSTIAEEVIKHDAITAGAVTVGTVVVPLFASALVAVAGVLAVVEAGLLLFADCDGLVAAGIVQYKCSDLIKQTSAGQKLPNNAEHAGTDSPDGCGSNSRYSTACTTTTARSIQTVLDLRGEWVSGGVPGPFVSVTGNSISIDMSASHRPTATGSVLSSTEIQVNFPDDKTYTATLEAPNVIKWSNNSSWTRVAAIETVIDLNGKWLIGGVAGPDFTVHGNAISIDMSALSRPKATGTIVNSSDISINFPDDKTYSGVLEKPGTIHWSNNSVWTKLPASPIKHLFVLMMENRSFDHLLGFQGIRGKDTQTGAETKAEDLSVSQVVAVQAPSNDFDNLKYTVSASAGDKTFHDVNHQFPNVLMQLCGQAEGQAFLSKGNLNGAPYPPVAVATQSGFAADYALNSDSKNPGEPMRGFAPGNVPVLTALAKEFVLCDHWFSAMAGPTEPNRMFAHAASSGGWDDSPSNSEYVEIFGLKSADHTSSGVTFDNGTIFDAMRRAKIPFRIYTGDGFPQVGLLSGISIYNDIDDFANFAGDINGGEYDAAYTFIEPRYDTISQTLHLPFVNNSQHPSNGVAIGEQLIKTVYETIRNSPLWNQSMLIIVWDEHGGFFDHVTPPPATPIPTGSAPGVIVGKKYGFKFDRYGPRVPAVVISPWCPQNMIEHRQHEHSFIPATIEQLFGLRPLTNRDTGVVGLHTLATLSAPRNVTVQIPDPITVGEPTEAVPGTPAGSSGTVSVAPIAGNLLPTTAIGPEFATAPAAPAGPTSLLDLDDPWLASALAVAIKAHIEAAPTEAAAIKARAVGLKTVGDLAQYYKDLTPIVQNAQTAARLQKVAARKLAAAQPGKLQVAEQAVRTGVEAKVQ